MGFKTSGERMKRLVNKMCLGNSLPIQWEYLFSPLTHRIHQKKNQLKTPINFKYTTIRRKKKKYPTLFFSSPSPSFSPSSSFSLSQYPYPPPPCFSFRFSFSFSLGMREISKARNKSQQFQEEGRSDRFDYKLNFNYYIIKTINGRKYCQHRCRINITKNSQKSVKIEATQQEINENHELAIH